MVPQTSKKKMNQAEVAQEQQIDLLNTSDSVRVIKDQILNPLVTWFMDLDYQYRDKLMTIRGYGDMGRMADLERVPPFAMQRKVSYYWIGDEINRSQQQIQQKIGYLNVLRQVQPLMKNYEVDLQAYIVDLTESVCGARIARQTVKDTRSLMSIDPETENMLMQMGHYVPVKPMDNPSEHIPSVQKSIQEDGDPFGLKTAHLVEHQIALQQQAQMAMMQQLQGGQGAPQAGGPRGPGPRPGAIPGQAQRPAQQPPGAIHQDQMGRGDPSVMPRKM